jgi:hypothetical protein
MFFFSSLNIIQYPVDFKGMSAISDEKRQHFSIRATKVTRSQKLLEDVKRGSNKYFRKKIKLIILFIFSC